MNASIVIRYYGSKEELFALASDFDLRLQDLNTIAWEQLGTTLVEHFLKRWDDKIGGGELAVLLRSCPSSDKYGLCAA